MKNLLKLMLCAAALSACEPFDMMVGTSRIRQADPASVVGKVDRPDSETQATDTTVWISCVEFEKGYDWSRDTVSREVPSTVVLLCDGKRVVSFPGGREAESGIEADTHFLREGHLYTVFTGQRQTLVRRDGEVLFRVDGRECITGVEVLEEGLATLGLDLDHTAVCYRVGGKQVYRLDGGEVVGGLHRDGKKLCFFCRRAVAQMTGKAYEYVMVLDGVVQPMTLPEDAVEVYDLRLSAGRLCAVVRTRTYQGPLLFVDGRSYPPPMQVHQEASCRLLVGTDGVVYAAAEEIAYYPTIFSMLWGTGGQKLYVTGVQTWYPFRGGAGFVNVAGDGQVSSFGVAQTGGEEIPAPVWNGKMPMRVRFLGASHAMMAGGTFHAVFNRPDAPPLHYVDLSGHEVPVSNGYVTALAVEIN